ncbi:MAG: diaminobutyrate--2-oxoglutarate transaminase family protein [Giesbergeria sp.]|uniref:diaminobutyrate--2-oxoglutarate transaminase family protein n=1 Tax=Giesbergeria sp. TaxID=2818473 RepID=UPI00261D7BF7|nr:diaminobutyrate--2-oxoglutarate transaminase family protein [Giesbergeria sp.]MDD2608529.1 diaminobutyrate--2-oxoglutarate transaminase family protein [Giesbergeria sp.]
MPFNSPAQNANYYLDYQAQVESNARTYPRNLPLAIASANNIYITDTNGKTYIDCLSCAGALALGHNHPVVLDAIQQHLSQGLPMQTLDFTSPIRHAFVQELLASLPPAFAARAKVQFCGPSGSDAVEAALKLVKTATGRRSILAYQGAYHGQTHGSLALMGNLRAKSAIPGLMPEVHFLPFPDAYRCGATCNSTDAGCTAQHHRCATLERLESVLKDDESGVPLPAAVILEVVQGEGGCNPAPDDWLREVRRLTAQYRVPLIVDEVQTGWGRTGSLYAFERAGIVPDVLVLSKAIGGGLPLALIVYDEALDLWQPGAHAGTFRGNLMAIGTGLATLRFIREQNLASHAAQMGKYLRSQLRHLQTSMPFLGDVRGRGLMTGVEIVDPATHDRNGVSLPDGECARAIRKACFERGLIIELGGRQGSVLRFLPPLVITQEQIDAVVAIVAAACQAVSADQLHRRSVAP